MIVIKEKFMGIINLRLFEIVLNAKKNQKKC